MHPSLDSIRIQHTAALDGFFTHCGDQLVQLADRCAASLSAGGTLLLCGNGGSACDAMHIAGEFVGRFVDDRPGLAAIALSADTGMITAIANDYAYDYIFARQVEALGKAGDVLIGLSTSGTSPNVVRAIAAAKEKGLFTVLFTGEKGKENKAGADLCLVVPSRVTAHVQEAHMVGLHGVTALVEQRLSPQNR